MGVILTNTRCDASCAFQQKQNENLTHMLCSEIVNSNKNTYHLHLIN